MLRKLFIIISTLAGTAIMATANTLPTLTMMVNGGTNSMTVPVGTTLPVTGYATDPDGDMSEHWLEIENPDHAWSWEGWLTNEPWAGGLVGSSFKSVKSSTFTFVQPGSYVLRTTAIDSSRIWVVSNWIMVTVTPSSVPSSVTPSPASVVKTPAPPAAANTVPSLELSLNADSKDLSVVVGTKVVVMGKATDVDGNMLEHWLEIQNPAGSWSWEGWLTSEPWAGALVGSGFSSTKTGDFTFDNLGTYSIRTTAIDPAGVWIISRTLHVEVTAAVAVTPPPPVTSPPDVTPPPVPTPPTFSGSVFKADGSLDTFAYVAYAYSWDRATVSARLGPTFESFHPGAIDDRPTNYKPLSRSTPFSFSNRSDPYELGPKDGPSSDGDYWSESGQVAYVPDDANTDPGLDRVQVFSYYNNVFAISPRLDYASGIPHPDQQTQDSNYVSMLGYTPRQPVAIVRNYAMLQNEALVIYRDGLLGVAGTQTSRDWWERPYPGILFPANKVPTSMAVTTSNEFALITIWDTTAHKGQLAVVALEGKYIAFHTWPYMGLPNQGSWSDMKLLGYVDLPMATPSAVSAVSNAWWSGPSQTAGQVLGQIDLGSHWNRESFRDGEPLWSMVVATKGYAIVSSKMENKAVIVDLTPLFKYVRDSYLASDESFLNTMNSRGAGPGKWPLTFAEKSDIVPHVIWQKNFASPTTVLAGPHIDRWSDDRQKAYVACEDGTIHILDTSPLMARFDWETVGTLQEMGSFKVGLNPVSMAFARFTEWGLPLVKNTPDPLNSEFYVACRGDREVDAVVTSGGQGTVYRRIRDTRMGDPVGVSVAGRGYIVSVTDFNGKKLLSFRVGGLSDRVGRAYYPGADGNASFEFAGELSFKGFPFAVNSANVN